MEEDLITTRWIPVTERKPDKEESRYTKYLIVVKWLDTILDKDQWKTYVDITRFNSYNQVWLNENESIIDDDEETMITHWMPLPSPPSDGVV